MDCVEKMKITADNNCSKQPVLYIISFTDSAFIFTHLKYYPGGVIGFGKEELITHNHATERGSLKPQEERMSMSSERIEHSIDQKVKSFSQRISRDMTIEEIDEDFFNALDVLRCLLMEKNHNIINELHRVYERKSNHLTVVAYKHGVIDGINAASRKTEKECERAPI